MERARARLDKRDKKVGVELLVDAYCDLVDATLLELIEQIGQRYDAPQVAESISMANDVKAKAKQYVPWAAGFIGEQRLPPVINHFHALMHEIESPRGEGHHMVLPLQHHQGINAQPIITSLRDGSAVNLDQGIDLLCEIVDELMVPLAIEPKNLLKFNFVVNKPLDGVISLSRTLLHRMLRKMGRQIPPDLYPLVGEHVGSFLLVDVRR